MIVLDFTAISYQSTVILIIRYQYKRLFVVNIFSGIGFTLLL